MMHFFLNATRIFGQLLSKIYSRINKDREKGCKDYWGYRKTFAGEMRQSRDFQLGKEQQKVGGAELS